MSDKQLAILLTNLQARLERVLTNLDCDLKLFEAANEVHLPRETEPCYLGESLLPFLDQDPEHWGVRETKDFLALKGLHDLIDDLQAQVTLLKGETAED
jgi:hypothetical protein